MAFAEVHVGAAVDKPLHKCRIALTEIIVTQQQRQRVLPVIHHSRVRTPVQHVVADPGPCVRITIDQTSEKHLGGTMLIRVIDLQKLFVGAISGDIQRAA